MVEIAACVKFRVRRVDIEIRAADVERVFVVLVLGGEFLRVVEHLERLAVLTGNGEQVEVDDIAAQVVGREVEPLERVFERVVEVLHL